MKVKPGLALIACFDTGFHRAQPDVAQAFALLFELSEAGIQRYGFHGLSYEYIASVLPEHPGSSADGRVVAHLGAGASMCALRGRRSVATTMGFTALDGLPMGTRTGRQRCRRCSHQRTWKLRDSLGHSDERRADDRPPCARAHRRLTARRFASARDAQPGVVPSTPPTSEMNAVAPNGLAR